MTYEPKADPADRFLYGNQSDHQQSHQLRILNLEPNSRYLREHVPQKALDQILENVLGKSLLL